MKHGFSFHIHRVNWLGFFLEEMLISSLRYSEGAAEKLFYFFLQVVSDQQHQSPSWLLEAHQKGTTFCTLTLISLIHSKHHSSSYIVSLRLFGNKNPFFVLIVWFFVFSSEVLELKQHFFIVWDETDRPTCWTWKSEMNKCLKKKDVKWISSWLTDEPSRPADLPQKEPAEFIVGDSWHVASLCFKEGKAQLPVKHFLACTTRHFQSQNKNK